MIDLRNYQQKCLDFLDSFEGKRVCIGSPTGSGKTVLFTFYTHSELLKGKSTLILVHRKELLEQTRKILKNHFDVNPVCIVAGKKIKFDKNKKVYLGMVETVFRRKALLEELKANIDNLIIDECHLMSFFKVIENFKKIIGFTATPQIIKKNDCLKNYYNLLYEVTSIDELIENNYLMKPLTYAPIGLVKDAAKMQLRTSMGDFNELDQERGIIKIFGSVIKNIEKFKKNRTLIFHPSIALSKKVNDSLNGLGYESYHLDGKTPEIERDCIKKRLKESRDAIINNVGVLTTGFDEPLIETVILSRLTKSENLFIQMVGRGSRIAEGKDNFILLDLFGNSCRLGLWEQKRDWGRKFSWFKEEEEEKKLAPVKICPECEHVEPAQAKVCSVCGFNFAARAEEMKIQIEQELILMEEVKMQDKFKLIIEEVKEKKYNNYAALYRIVDYILLEKGKRPLEEATPDLLEGLKAWIEALKEAGINKRFDSWHKNFIYDAYENKIK